MVASQWLSCDKSLIGWAVACKGQKPSFLLLANKVAKTVRTGKVFVFSVWWGLQLRRRSGHNDATCWPPKDMSVRFPLFSHQLTLESADAGKRLLLSGQGMELTWITSVERSRWT